VKVLLFLFAILHPFLSEAAGVDRDDFMERKLLRGIELLYDSETDEAEELFRNTLNQRTWDPSGHFYMAMVTWSRLATGFWSSKMEDEYLERIDRTIAVARELIEERKADSYTYLYLGGALGFKGRFFLMEHKWFSSFSLAVEAVDALKTCQAMDPANKEVLLGLGIFDYYTARLSGFLKFMTYLLLHKGDREEGLRKLNQAAEEAPLSSIEAKSVLLHIFLFVEPDYKKALPLARELSGRFRNSRIYKYLEGLSYIRLGMEPEFRAAVADMKAKAEKEESEARSKSWLRRSLYLEATDELLKGRHEEARQKLDAILDFPDPDTDPYMIAWPLLKKGVSYDLENRREKAIEIYTRVKDMENGAGAQFASEKFLKKPVKRKDPLLGY
jgi:tetratricopeptide (TPR) repeat protein